METKQQILDRKALAMVLKSERMIAGLTQDQLAERVGISPRTLRTYESGKREPSASQFAVIADALGRTMDELHKMASARLADPVTRQLLLAGISPEDTATADPVRPDPEPESDDGAGRALRTI